MLVELNSSLSDDGDRPKIKEQIWCRISITYSSYWITLPSAVHIEFGDIKGSKKRVERILQSCLVTKLIIDNRKSLWIAHEKLNLKTYLPSIYKILCRHLHIFHLGLAHSLPTRLSMWNVASFHIGSETLRNFHCVQVFITDVSNWGFWGNIIILAVSSKSSIRR